MFCIMLDVAKWQRAASANGADCRIWADLGNGCRLSLMRMPGDRAEIGIGCDALARRLTAVRTTERVIYMMDETYPVYEDKFPVGYDPKLGRLEHPYDLVINRPLKLWRSVFEALRPILVISHRNDFRRFSLETLLEYLKRGPEGLDVGFEQWSDHPLNCSWLAVYRKGI